eukprot:scaffold6357_cov93-Cylindrotheca_fusiformis.AAC.1
MAMDAYDPATGPYHPTPAPPVLLPSSSDRSEPSVPTPLAPSSAPPSVSASASLPSLEREKSGSPPEQAVRNEVPIEREQVVEREQEQVQSVKPPMSTPPQVEPTRPSESVTESVKVDRPSTTRPTPSPVLRRSARSTKGIKARVFDPDPSKKSYNLLSKKKRSNDGLPIWNEYKNKYEYDSAGSTPPFDEGFVLTPEHESYKLFKGKTDADDGGKCGYYDIHAAFLGYKPKDKPKFMFVDSQADLQSFEFMKAAKTDPDTLSWDEAMNNADEVDRWRAAADKEIRALEHKGTWLEVPESKATVRVIPGTW